jgi:hypothetical protein
MPVGPWYCDVCDDLITDPADGYVVWGRDGGDDGDWRDRDYLIIHTGRCDPKGLEYPASLPLTAFMEVDGLTRLLSDLSIGPLKLAGDDSRNTSHVENLNDFVDLVRRVQIPQYEEARRRFGESTVQDLTADWNETLPYTQEGLTRILGEPLY